MMGMNYGGVGSNQSNTRPWSPWKEKFCWWPTRIVLTAEHPYDFSYSKHVWLKKIFVRRRPRYPSNDTEQTYEYEYAEDLFDLMKQDRL